MSAVLMADNDARDYIDRLRKAKGLSTIATVGEGVYHIAGCVDANKREIARLSGEFAGFRSEQDDMKTALERIERNMEKLIWERRNGGGGGGNGTGQPFGVTLVRQGLYVVGMGFVAVLMMLAFASPQAAELLRLIFGGGSSTP